MKHFGSQVQVKVFFSVQNEKWDYLHKLFPGDDPI